MLRLFKRASQKKPSKAQNQPSVSKTEQLKSKDEKAVVKWHIAPFRSFSDFFSEAIWGLPTFSKTARVTNRIVNNLIYYQTNYFILGIELTTLFRFATKYLTWRISMSCLVISIHAMFRKRNVPNKAVNSVEAITGHKTPMGIILKAIGLIN